MFRARQDAAPHEEDFHDSLGESHYTTFLGLRLPRMPQKNYSTLRVLPRSILPEYRASQDSVVESYSSLQKRTRTW